MKDKIIAAALIKSVIECKTTHFAECAEKILQHLSIVEEILTVLFKAVGSAEFLNRTNFSYKETTDPLGDLVLYGLKMR